MDLTPEQQAELDRLIAEATATADRLVARLDRMDAREANQ